jgi:hypothetical protein
MDFSFLRSNRFWVAMLAAVSIYLETKGFIGAAERNFVATIAASFITVRTIDKFSEK